MKLYKKIKILFVLKISFMKFKPVDLISKKLTILYGHSNLEIQEEVSLPKDMVIPMEEILETENILLTNLLRK
jgi:hypothetical protein